MAKIGFKGIQTLDIKDDNISEDDSEDGRTIEDWIEETRKQNISTLLEGVYEEG